MKNKTAFYIGCSGFYNSHWRGIFYPEKLPQKDWFDFYSQQFNSVEINSSFYKFPTAESLGKWNKKSPDHFLFSVKAPRIITHFKKFVDCKKQMSDFYTACVNGLGDKLGCTLFQLPPGVQYDADTLLRIIGSLDPQFKNVIEFRHKSWWKQSVYDLLSKNNITFCSTSHPALPATVIKNSTTGYIRLHGNKKMFYSSYSDESLHLLHQTVARKGFREVFVYFNNTAGTAGVLNAKQLQKIVGQQS
ncbi:MAG TPA: DUF72 domain-containing protein [Chitinophagales bacterium]|nr:DUF72 domain-containing protein [Chitinophagales bacterium]